jgi:hypothetical protein
MVSKLLSLNQTAELTGLPAAWLKREADGGRIPCVRAGRFRRFDVKAVMLALEARQDCGTGKIATSALPGGEGKV